MSSEVEEADVYAHIPGVFGAYYTIPVQFGRRDVRRSYGYFVLILDKITT